MGRSYTPTYRLEFWEHPQGTKHQQAWSKGCKPTDYTLEQWIHSYAHSLEMGGVNSHISTAIGYVPYPCQAQVVRQATGDVVASWKAGVFQVY